LPEQAHAERQIWRVAVVVAVPQAWLVEHAWVLMRASDGATGRAAVLGRDTRLA
jgi:hypothetical protein